MKKWVFKLSPIALFVFLFVLSGGELNSLKWYYVIAIATALSWIGGMIYHFFYGIIVTEIKCLENNPCNYTYSFYYTYRLSKPQKAYLIIQEMETIDIKSLTTLLSSKLTQKDIMKFNTSISKFSFELSDFSGRKIQCKMYGGLSLPS